MKTTFPTIWLWVIVGPSAIYFFLSTVHFRRTQAKKLGKSFWQMRATDVSDSDKRKARFVAGWTFFVTVIFLICERFF